MDINDFFGFVCSRCGEDDIYSKGNVWMYHSDEIFWNAHPNFKDKERTIYYMCDDCRWKIILKITKLLEDSDIKECVSCREFLMGDLYVDKCKCDPVKNIRKKVIKELNSDMESN